MSENCDKLRNLVMFFRISELQNLMVYTGKSKYGNKLELQARAVELCSLNSTDINLKIKQLYSTMTMSLESNISRYNSNRNASTSSRDSTTVNHQQPSYPTYSDVTLKKLPFYKLEGTLLKPCSLQPCGKAKFQEQTFTFVLQPSEATAVSSSQYKNENKLMYRTQIQMRFSLLETSCEQDDNFPISLCVKVNGKLCPLPNPIPTNKPGVEPERPPRPINITPLCKLSSTVPNYINVSWASQLGKAHTISVYMVENLTYQDLLAQLKAKGQRQPDYTRALIKEKLADQDQEIATTSCKVTLACPLGKMRMVTPARASTCDHLQCFDAQLYLAMNEKKPKWICPVCNKSALMENLLVDGFFTELVSSNRLPADEHEIVLHNDGSWDPLPPKTPDHLKVQDGVSVEGTVRLTFSDSEDGQGQTRTQGAVQLEELVSSSVEDCITLVSDSEEETELSTRKLPRLDGGPYPGVKQILQTMDRMGSPDIITIDDD